MKRVSTALALVLGTFVSFSSAAQVQGFVSGYAPGTVDEKTESNGSHLDINSDFMWALGAEFLTNPVGPLVVGGGFGYFSIQKDGGDKVMMPAFPVFLSIGAIGPEKWTVRPYLGARVGYPLPATKFMTWWDKPQHFFVTGNIGAQLPYHMGLEFDCTYLTMDKYIKKTDANYRLSTVKFGGSITVHFDLFKDSAVSDDSSAEKDTATEPAADNSADTNNPYDASENTEYTDPYASYSDPYVEQPAEDSMTGESAAEPTEEPVAEPTSEEMSAEDAPAEEAAAEEIPAEEPVAEDAVAETPSEEPAAEPALEPAPEPKPAAKKAASKKKSAKKTAKKASTKKKAAKKKSTAKKSSKKKK